MSGERDFCWICLGEEGELVRPCSCPRFVHQDCIARWQLQQVGREQETECRFCHSQLPDWKQAHAALPKATPTMTVVYNGKTHHIQATDRESFENQIRSIFGLRQDEAIELTFSCKEPSGSNVTLEGWGAWDAAVHLASLSAGKRLAQGGGQQGGGCGAVREPPEGQRLSHTRRWLRWGAKH